MVHAQRDMHKETQRHTRGVGLSPFCNWKKKRAYNTKTQIQQLKTQEEIPIHITLLYLFLLQLEEETGL